MFCGNSGKKTYSEGTTDYLFDGPVKEDKSVSTKKLVIGGSIVLGILAIGAITAAYFLNPSFHATINHSFAQLQHGNMTAGQGLLYIGLPVVGATILIMAAVKFYKAHQKRKTHDLFVNGSSLRELFRTAKQLKPITKKRLKIALIATIAVAVIAVVGFLIFHYVPAANQWMHHQAIPAAQNILNHQTKIWQGLVFIGGGAALGTLLTTLAIYCYKQAKKAQRKEEIEEYTKQPEYGTDL